MKKTAIKILLAALLIVPIIVAIVNFNLVKYGPVKEKDITKIVIEDVSGEIRTYDREKMGEEADRVISLFFRMNSRLTPIVAVPETVMQEKAYLVTFYTKVKDKGETYRYYFSKDDPGACYMFNSDGESFQLGPDDAAEFLASDLSHSYYENSSLPTLWLSGTIQVAPSQAKWTYSNPVTKSRISSDTSGLIASETQYFSDNVTLSLKFEAEPDYCGIKVTDNEGEVLFEDQIMNLGSLSVDEEKEVNVDVSAKWYEDESRTYSGEASYSFKALVSPDPYFRLSADSVNRGGLITVTAKNVSDVSSIEFSSEPDISLDPENPLKPTFFEEGNLVHALIPMHAGLAAGEYEFKFTCAGKDQSMLVTVTDPGYGESRMTVDDAKVAAGLSETAKAEFESVVAQIASADFTERKFEGNFLYGNEYFQCGNPIRSYGSWVLVNGGDVYKFLSNGYDAQYGWEPAKVSAVNNGTVVYVGSTAFTGNIAVVDHGCGVMSWYWNMGEVTKRVGDTVSKGDFIAASGSTGLTDMYYGVHIAISVDGYFINPSVTWSETGISFPEIN